MEGEEATGYTSLIFVKENVCEDAAWGKGHEFLDPEDSSLTRYVGCLCRLADSLLTLMQIKRPLAGNLRGGRT